MTCFGDITGFPEFGVSASGKGVPALLVVIGGAMTFWGFMPHIGGTPQVIIGLLLIVLGVFAYAKE